MCAAEMGNVRSDLQGQKASDEPLHYAEGNEVMLGRWLSNFC
jgi:hypothetical protein